VPQNPAALPNVIAYYTRKLFGFQEFFALSSEIFFHDFRKWQKFYPIPPSAP